MSDNANTSPTATERPVIAERERQAIITSLQAGLVPAIGLRHLQVGRKQEIAALTSDLDKVQAGGASFRIITGDNGSGKTFLQRLLRTQAAEEGMVVLAADLTVNHRLHGTQGRGRALLASLLASVYTKNSPTGNSLRTLLETWLNGVNFETSGAALTPEAMTKEIATRLRGLKEFPGGFEFATVLGRYYEGFASDNQELQDAALRWLRAEYSTKTEARHDLGVRRIIGDEDIYTPLKMFAAFCKIAGYKGVIVILDELSALTQRLPHVRAREANVQVLLAMINDCFQGGSSSLGFLLAGTPDALEDPDRGLFTVPALRSRLQCTAADGLIDYSAPVLHLKPFSRDDLLVLLHNVLRVHTLGDNSKYQLPDDGVERFLQRALSRSGRTMHINPRDVLRPFVTALNLVEQDSNRSWSDTLAGVFAGADRPGV